MEKVIERIESLLKKGRLCEARNEADIALQNSSDNLRIAQLYGLSLARLGLSDQASTFMEGLKEKGNTDAETMGILGRVYKDIWKLSDSKSDAEKSFEIYNDAYTETNDTYVGINASTMALGLNKIDTAQSIAKKIIDQSESGANAYWDYATLGEAYLILGEQEKSKSYYQLALEHSENQLGSLDTTFRQVELLSKYIPVDESIKKLYPAPRVIVFAGHMIDHPTRLKARFPEEISALVKEDIFRYLEEVDARVGFTSLSCGADMLFAECMIERNCELNIILPFNKEDFLETSVDFAGKVWIDKFHTILDKADSVKFITEEKYLGDDHLFDLTIRSLMGISLLKAEALRSESWFLTVWSKDPKELQKGGTGDSVEQWPYPERMHNINPSKYFDKVKLPDYPRQIANETVEKYDLQVHRYAKYILFADIVGFSKMVEEQTPFFMINFMNVLAAELAKTGLKPDVINTWGDALFVVFDGPTPLIEYAIRIQRIIKETNWETYHLPSTLNIRIALHAGPVYVGIDPILNRTNAYGSQVNRTARMEPVTVPGSIFASAQYASLLKLENPDKYNYDYVGIIKLPKNFGTQEMYHIR